MNPDDLAPELRFNDPTRHTLALLDTLSALLARPKHEFQEAMVLATQLTCNAHPAARRFVQMLKAMIAHPDAGKRLDKLLKLCDVTDRLPRLSELRRDTALMQQLYSPEGPTYIEGGREKQKLAVVFTTIFNNFGVANLILLAILQSYGVSVLLLRDGSRANYLRGGCGFGDNLGDIAGKLTAFAQEKSIADIYLLGYSSGGYAACYVSTRLRCAAHLGFSIPADFSLDTELPSDFFMPRDLRALFERRYLLDLASVLPDSSARQRLIVGTKSRRDASHARHLQQAGMDVVALDDCVHDTPETLIANGELRHHLDWLFDQRA